MACKRIILTIHSVKRKWYHVTMEINLDAETVSVSAARK